MKKIPFKSPGHFLVSLLFMILTGICLLGSWYNPLHLINAGLCGLMAWGTYKSW